MEEIKGSPGGCVGDYCQDLMRRLATCPFLSCLCVALAFLMCLRILKCLIGTACFLAKRVVGGRRLSHYGEWAVVTGASDGIGRAIAVELASHTCVKNILLIARAESKLLEVAAEVERAGGKSKILVSDFSKETPEETLAKIIDATRGLDVGILINNAGVSYPFPLFSDEVQVELVQELLNVNVRSYVLTTKAVLPGMKTRGRGLIVNIGSGSSVIPSDPLSSIYSATKAAVDTFSRCLKAEVSPSGIDVQCHIPLLITTKLSKCKTASLFIPSAKTYAAAAVRSMKLASCCSSASVSPYFPHALTLLLIGCLPDASWGRIRLRQTLALREKALNKRENEKKVT